MRQKQSRSLNTCHPRLGKWEQKTVQMAAHGRCRDSLLAAVLVVPTLCAPPLLGQNRRDPFLCLQCKYTPFLFQGGVSGFCTALKYHHSVISHRSPLFIVFFIVTLSTMKNYVFPYRFFCLSPPLPPGAYGLNMWVDGRSVRSVVGRSSIMATATFVIQDQKSPIPSNAFLAMFLTSPSRSSLLIEFAFRKLEGKKSSIRVNVC